MKKLIGGMIVALGTMCVWVHGYTKAFTQCGLDIGNNWPLPHDMECAPITHRLGFIEIGIAKQKVKD